MGRSMGMSFRSGRKKWGKGMSQVEPPLKRLEFVKSLIENVLGDNLRLFTGGGRGHGRR